MYKLFTLPLLLLPAIHAHTISSLETYVNNWSNNYTVQKRIKMRWQSRIPMHLLERRAQAATRSERFETFERNTNKYHHFILMYYKTPSKLSELTIKY